MMIVGFPPAGLPLNSVIFALTLPTTGRASPIACPPPIFEPAGHARGPFVWRADGEQVLKYLAFTTAPRGKRSVVLVRGGGFAPVSSLTFRTVRSVRPPRVLFLSPRTTLAVN